MAPELQVDDSWRRAFPGAAAGWLVLSGAANPPGPAALEPARQEVIARLRERFTDRAAIKADPVMAAYQAFYKRFQKSYHVAQQVESVAVKGKEPPRPGALVEAMFLAELDSGLLTAGHDAAALQGTVRLAAASGEEVYTTLAGVERRLKPGDMCMADQAGVISAVLYGPDSRTRLRPETVSAAFAVYAAPGVGPAAVAAHLERLAELVRLAAPAAAVELLQTPAA